MGHWWPKEGGEREKLGMNCEGMNFDMCRKQYSTISRGMTDTLETTRHMVLDRRDHMG